MSEPAPAADWDLLIRGAASFGVSLQAEQMDAFRRYLELLCEWNRRFNLTSVERPDEILIKHFLDSLSCALLVDFPRRRSLVDVGTGAGFPGLALKIAFPHLQVTLLDAVQKRLGFLDHVAAELRLRDVTTVHARAEDAARGADPAKGASRSLPRGLSDLPGTGRRPAGSGNAAPALRVPSLREAFDVATARAVARLNVLAEWLLPFAAVGGVALAMKGPESEAEAAEAGCAVRLLGGGAPQVRVFMLPETDIGRSLVLISKERPTPGAYPRLPGAARKAPL